MFFTVLWAFCLLYCDSFADCEDLSCGAADDKNEQFVLSAMELLAHDTEHHHNNILNRERRQSGPGFYALPLPYLPGDVQSNLNDMRLVTDVDKSLVELANSLFGSNEVLNPVVNFQQQNNPAVPSFDPFDLYSKYSPQVSQEIPSSILRLLTRFLCRGVRTTLGFVGWAF